MQASSCPVCSTPAANVSQRGDIYDVQCPRCGPFSIVGSIEPGLRARPLSQDQIANASGWLRENPGHTINSYNRRALEELPSPSISSRADRLLLEIARRQKHIGERVDIPMTGSSPTTAAWLGVTWSRHPQEVVYLLADYLGQDGLGLIRGHPLTIMGNTIGGMVQISLTPKGHEYLHQLRMGRGDGSIGFCAMWFDTKVANLWTDGIEPGIRDAGYEPMRIDKYEHTNKIDDELIAMIRRSKFIVADFTGHRNGVYFEAGFARGLGLQVVWTCEESAIPEAHFDTRQYNFLPWTRDAIEDFRRRLTLRIEATMGRGPIRPASVR